jgi:hypothetical protein
MDNVLKDYPTLRVPAKRWRAQVIAGYVRQAGLRGVVCFGCGNAAAELRKTGLYVVDMSARGDAEPKRWWGTAEIYQAFGAGGLFDATSGHLPLWMMLQVSKIMQEEVSLTMHGEAASYIVPCGSGETVLELAWAFPRVRFIPAYNFEGALEATKRDECAPLNYLIDTFKTVIF